MGVIRVGTSGWRYDDWHDGFYPSDVTRDDELAHLGRRLDTVEVNATFYGLPDPETCRRWAEAVPSPFRFSVKGSRFITHSKRLRDPETAVANFLAAGILELGPKLGPLLWQLPPDLDGDPDRLARFLDLLPSDTDEARALASHHDERVDAVAPGDGRNHRLRHVLEVRNEGWLTPAVSRLARDAGVALAFSDAADWPYTEEVTAGFVYLRLHGPGETYASRYGPERLERWADRVEAWWRADQPPDARTITDRRPPSRHGRDVYVYFDNDVDGHAPADAEDLLALLADRGVGGHGEG